MKKIYLFCGIILVILILWFATTDFTTPSPRFDQIITQLNGGKCTYEIKVEGGLVKRGLFSGFIRRSDSERCIIDAAKILANKQEEGDVVLPLIAALQKYHNVDSGDGIIPVRSEIAAVLGKLGDKRALTPLNDILYTDDLTTLSSSATGRSVPEKQTSFPAVKEAIQAINEANK
jgi:hypothetical protein